jgi:non-specific serine/threonine protein kinase
MEMIEAAFVHASGTSDRSRGRALVARSNLLRPGDLEQSARDADAALELCSAAGDVEGCCMALDMVAAHAAYFGDGDRARAAAAEERALAERLGDPYHLAIAAMRQCWGAAGPRAMREFADEAIPLLRGCGNLRGIVEMSAGMQGWWLNERDFEAASAVAEEGLRAARELGEPMALALAIGNAGLTALFLERTELAGQLLRESIEVQERERLDWWSAEPVICLACVAAAEGDAERAATLIGFSEVMPESPVAAGDQLVRDELLDRFIAPARARLGERAWKPAAATGAAMTHAEVVELVLDRDVAARRVQARARPG